MSTLLLQLGLCPRPHWGSLQALPDPIAGFKKAALLHGKGGAGKGIGEEEELSCAPQIPVSAPHDQWNFV